MAKGGGPKPERIALNRLPIQRHRVGVIPERLKPIDRLDRRLFVIDGYQLRTGEKARRLFRGQAIQHDPGLASIRRLHADQVDPRPLFSS